MKVAVWGAGNVGRSLIWRLANSDFATELLWANGSERDGSYEKVQAGSIDVGHGLVFGSCCRAIVPIDPRKDAELELMKEFSDVIVVTVGTAVQPGKDRDTVLEPNVVLCHEIGLKLARYQGVVVVVTNPLDVCAQVLWNASSLPEQRVFGLGTVVETARLRAEVAGRLSPPRLPMDVAAHAIGTHDKNSVCVIASPPALAASKMHDASILSATEAVRNAARRVREAGEAATVHPIVEGLCAVLRALALRRGETMTVSVLDPDDSEQRFYSVPCLVGAGVGYVRLGTGELSPATRKQLDIALQELSKHMARARQALDDESD